jgi:hypothetical protein
MQPTFVSSVMLYKLDPLIGILLNVTVYKTKTMMSDKDFLCFKLGPDHFLYHLLGSLFIKHPYHNHQQIIIYNDKFCWNLLTAGAQVPELT